jgi:serine/threonine protein kinase
MFEPRALIEFGAFSEMVLRKYTRDVLTGLAFLHSKRYVHRDIKPTNLLINKNMIKLADFGCAVSSLADSSGKSAGLDGAIGTTMYMAPEVMRGNDDDAIESPTTSDIDIHKKRMHTRGGYGRKADVWSLGLSFIEVSTAEAPFRTAASAIYKVCVSKEYP